MWAGTGLFWALLVLEVRKGKHVIKMCTEGKENEEVKKLLGRSINEFKDTVKNSREDRCLALIGGNKDGGSGAAAYASTSQILHRLFPLDMWEEFELKDWAELN